MSDTAEKLSVTVTSAMAERMRAEVEAGRYGSVAEVMRDALRLWEKREDELALLRARIQASIDDPRPRVPLAEVRRRIKRRHDEAMTSKKDDAA